MSISSSPSSSLKTLPSVENGKTVINAKTH